MPEIIALQAFAWVLSDSERAARLLTLTGLDADQLRARANDPILWAATFDFLAGHEPDLIACAQALGLSPEHLMDSARKISQ